jgi:uncharacterized protein (TIGR02246 family)
MRMPFILGVLFLAACSKGGEGGGSGGGSGAGSGAGTAARRPADPKADRAAIQKLRAELVANVNAGDIKRVTARYVPDAVLIQNFGPSVVGQEEFHDFLRAEFDTASMELATSAEELHFVGDDLAIERGKYHTNLDFRSGSPSQTDSGNYLFVWQRQPDGSWKVLLDLDDSTISP